MLVLLTLLLSCKGVGSQFKAKYKKRPSSWAAAACRWPWETSGSCDSRRSSLGKYVQVWILIGICIMGMRKGAQMSLWSFHAVVFTACAGSPNEIEPQSCFTSYQTHATSIASICCELANHVCQYIRKNSQHAVFTTARWPTVAVCAAPLSSHSSAGFTLSYSSTCPPPFASAVVHRH